MLHGFADEEKDVIVRTILFTGHLHQCSGGQQTT